MDFDSPYRCLEPAEVGAPAPDDAGHPAGEVTVTLSSAVAARTLALAGVDSDPTASPAGSVWCTYVTSTVLHHDLDQPEPLGATGSAA